MLGGYDEDPVGGEDDIALGGYGTDEVGPDPGGVGVGEDGGERLDTFL